MEFWFGAVIGLIVGFFCGSFGTLIDDINRWINNRKD